MIRASRQNKILEGLLFPVLLLLIFYFVPSWLSNSLVLLGLIVGQLLWAFFYEGFLDIFSLPVLAILVLGLINNLLS